jgi:membrane-bound ClpP family serine protease
MWQQWINAILGIVLLILSFTTLVGTGAAMTIGIIGFIVMVLGFWGAAAERTHLREGTHQHA